jgi:hypothetical protein
MQGSFGQYMNNLIKWTHIYRTLLTSNASTSITPLGLRFEASRWTRKPYPSHRAFGLGFVAQPRNLMVLWVNHCKPHKLGAASTPISSWLGCHVRPGSILVLRLNQETVKLSFDKQPRNPNGFVGKPLENPASYVWPPRQASGTPSLSPSAPDRSTWSCPVQWLGHYSHLSFGFMDKPSNPVYKIWSLATTLHRLATYCLRFLRRY